MELTFDETLGSGYRSASQMARIVTEDWVRRQAFCPSCGGPLAQYPNNLPVADFYCQSCSEDFELKAKKDSFSPKVSAGAYSSMIERISSDTKPNFFFLAYIAELIGVQDFFIIPKHFIVPSVIEKRTPLSQTARRAGWTGSNILFSKIPRAGHIYYVHNNEVVPKTNVLSKWHKTVFLKDFTEPDSRGWLVDTMRAIDSVGAQEFSLTDIYAHVEELSVRHPNNNNIRPKIRQQLQLLRDKGYLEFVSPGKYRLN